MGSGSATEQSPAALETALIEAMVSREDIVERASSLTLAELFPAAGASKVLADAFRADVVHVDEGRAFVDTFDPAQASGIEEIAFDDPRADWRSFHVRLKVLESYSGDVEVGSEVTIGIAFGRDVEMKIVAEGLMSMSELVVFTAPGDFVVPYDPTIRPVLWDGAFLSPVEGDQVPWPAVSEGGGHEASLVSNFDNLSELRKIDPS